MSHFPLPSGCREVCRPERSETRSFTPAALTRIVRKMLEQGYDEAQVCEAVFLGGARCECFGAMKVGAYADILYEQTATVAFERGTAMMQEVIAWVKTIQDWMDWVEVFVGDFVGNVPPVLRKIKIVQLILTTIERALDFAKWTASALIFLDEIFQMLDTEAQALKKVSEFAQSVCVVED